MERLQMITFAFPSSNEAETEWNYFFYKLLQEIPSFKKDEMLRPSFSETAFPSTDFRTGNTKFPMLIFNTNEKIELKIADLIISNKNDDTALSGMIKETNFEGSSVTDANTIANLYRQLKGRLVGMDHTGVNLPVSKLLKSHWDDFIAKISRVCNLYNYPGEDWPFIIPADEHEHLTDITQFTVKRTPKFEIVYDSYSDKPIIQFALETNISKEDMETIFPDPFGFAIPGLEDIFRSIFVKSPWDDAISFRFDLYYMSSTVNELTDWETGEWLIINGGRIKNKRREDILGKYQE